MVAWVRDIPPPEPFVRVPPRVISPVRLPDAVLVSLPVMLAVTWPPPLLT
jgi:hypothetical protein